MAASARDDIDKQIQELSDLWTTVEEGRQKAPGIIQLPSYGEGPLSRAADKFKKTFTTQLGDGLDAAEKTKVEGFFNAGARKELSSFVEQLDAHMRQQFSSWLTGTKADKNAWAKGFDQAAGAIHKKCEDVKGGVPPADHAILEKWEKAQLAELARMQDEVMKQEVKRLLQRKDEQNRLAHCALLYDALNVGHWVNRSKKGEPDPDSTNATVVSGADVKKLDDGLYQYTGHPKKDFEILLENGKASIISRAGRRISKEQEAAECKALVDLLAGGQGAEVIKFDVPTPNALRGGRAGNHIYAIREAAIYAAKHNIQVELGPNIGDRINTLVGGKELLDLITANNKKIQEDIEAKRIAGKTPLAAEEKQVKARETNLSKFVKPDANDMPAHEYKKLTERLQQNQAERKALSQMRALHGGASLEVQGKALLGDEKTATFDAKYADNAKQKLTDLAVRMENLKAMHDLLKAEMANLKQDVLNSPNDSEHHTMQQKIFTKLQEAEIEYKQEKADIEERLGILEDKPLQTAVDAVITAATPPQKPLGEQLLAPKSQMDVIKGEPLNALPLNLKEFKDAAEAEARTQSGFKPR